MILSRYMCVVIVANIGFIVLKGDMFGNCFSLGTACEPVLQIARVGQIGCRSPTTWATYNHDNWRMLCPIDFKLGTLVQIEVADDPYCSVGQWSEVKVTL